MDLEQHASIDLNPYQHANKSLLRTSCSIQMHGSNPQCKQELEKQPEAAHCLLSLQCRCYRPPRSPLLTLSAMAASSPAFGSLNDSPPLAGASAPPLPPREPALPLPPLPAPALPPLPPSVSRRRHESPPSACRRCRSLRVLPPPTPAWIPSIRVHPPPPPLPPSTSRRRHGSEPLRRRRRSLPPRAGAGGSALSVPLRSTTTLSLNELARARIRSPPPPPPPRYGVRERERETGG